jgi:hypothetical protein
MMVLNPAFTLQNKDAFPGFFIPQLSMAHGKADPVISMHDHTKFFLLRSLCNGCKLTASCTMTWVMGG